MMPWLRSGDVSVPELIAPTTTFGLIGERTTLRGWGLKRERQLVGGRLLIHYLHLTILALPFVFFALSLALLNPHLHLTPYLAVPPYHLKLNLFALFIPPTSLNLLLNLIALVLVSTPPLYAKPPALLTRPHLYVLLSLSLNLPLLFLTSPPLLLLISTSFPSPSSNTSPLTLFLICSPSLIAAGPLHFSLPSGSYLKLSPFSNLANLPPHPPRTAPSLSPPASLVSLRNSSSPASHSSLNLIISSLIPNLDSVLFALLLLTSSI